MASITRLLSRKPRIDEAELEGVRSRTMVRLAALNDPSRTQASTDPAGSTELDAPVSEAPVSEAPAAAAATDVIELPEPMLAIDPGEAEAVDWYDARPTTEGLPVSEPVEVAEPSTDPPTGAIPTARTPRKTRSRRADEPIAGAPKANRPKRRREAVPVMAEPSPSEATSELWPGPWISGWAIVEPAVEPETEPAAGAAAPAPDEPAAEAVPAIPTVAPAIPTVAPRPAAPRKPRPSRPAADVATARRPAPTPVQASPTATATAFCPYCALSLDPAPTSSRRCVRCKQRIMVKRIDGRLVYLTQAAVEVFESERRRALNFGRWSKERAQWLKLAASVRADAGRMARIDTAPLSEGIVASARALYFSTVDRSFREAKREDRWEDASRQKRDQAAALYRLAGSPVPPPDEVLAVHREAVAAELRGIGKMAKEAELVGATCCEICRAGDGGTFRIASELRTTRLPHEGCPKGVCHCRWDLALRDQMMVRRYLKRKVRAARAGHAGAVGAPPPADRSRSS